MRTAGNRDQGTGISAVQCQVMLRVMEPAPATGVCAVGNCDATAMAGSCYCGRCREELEALDAMERAKAARNERRRQQIAEGRGMRQRLRRWMEQQEGLVLLVFVSCMLAGFMLETLPFWLSLVTGKDVTWTR